MILYVGVAIVATAFILLVAIRQVTVLEYERGLRYDGGRFKAVLEPGSYWILSTRTRIKKLDIRPLHVTVPGQEVVTSDGVGIKITLSAQYKIKDPLRAVHSIASYESALYLQLQLALRELVIGTTAENLLAQRVVLGPRLLEAAAPKVAEYGIELTEAEIKDVMFPGDLKKVFSQVVRARQEGLAALEKARGESAALRNLANAAALVEARPALLYLRLLQAIGQDSGNTVVLNLGAAELAPLNVSASKSRESDHTGSNEERS